MKASEAGLNPYTPDGIGGQMVKVASDDSASILDPRAPGLDGDILDQLLKGRWQEGYQTGFKDGHAAGRRRYQGIFDDGFDQGQTNGLLAARAQMASELGVLIERVQSALREIAGKTGSLDIRVIAEEAKVEAQTMVEVISLTQPGPQPDQSTQ